MTARNDNDLTVREALSIILNVVNLSSVTTATNGDAVETAKYNKKTVFITVSGNTGAVTVTIQHSADGTNWYDLQATTYTATNATNDYSWEFHSPYVRVTTSTQSNSTVKATITARGI